MKNTFAMRMSGPIRAAAVLVVIGMWCLPLGAQNKTAKPMEKMAAQRTRHCGGPAIAYLAHSAGVLWVDKKHVAEVASLYHVEKPTGSKWNIQIPGGAKMSVKVFEIDGNVPDTVMSYAEGDVATLPNLKCSGSMAAVTNKCTNAADGTSASYTGIAYKMCMLEDQATCNSSVQKVGTWTYYSGANCSGSTTGSTEDKTETCK